MTIPAGMGWAAFLVVAVEIAVTYSRIPPGELYHVSGTGIAAGFGRALVFLNFPIALAALPLIALAADQLRESRLAVATAMVAAGAVRRFWSAGSVRLPPDSVSPRRFTARPT